MKNQQLSLDFIKQLKQQILASRYVVAKIANAEMLRLYFSIGQTVDEEFKRNKWGAKINDEIASRLQQELPGLRGFSGSNIRKMRIFYQEWHTVNTICPTVSDKLASSAGVILPTVSDKLKKAVNINDTKFSSLTNKSDKAEVNAFFSIPFSHHYEIILKTGTEKERWYYIHKTAQNYWSVRHLRTELKNQSHLQEEQLPNNFKLTLPDVPSNKATRSFKDQNLAIQLTYLFTKK